MNCIGINLKADIQGGKKIKFWNSVTVQRLIREEFVDNRQGKCVFANGVSCAVRLVSVVKAKAPVYVQSVKLTWLKFVRLYFEVQENGEGTPANN